MSQLPEFKEALAPFGFDLNDSWCDAQERFPAEQKTFETLEAAVKDAYEDAMARGKNNEMKPLLVVAYEAGRMRGGSIKMVAAEVHDSVWLWYTGRFLDIGMMRLL